MSKAEEQALKAYPVLSLTNDTNAPKRKYFIDGYALAEQDMIEKFRMWLAYSGYSAKGIELVLNKLEQITEKN